MGCRFLILPQWPNLINLSLRNDNFHLESNEIPDKGCKYLAASEWSNLQSLLLCNHRKTQGAVKLVIRDANTWRKLSGET